MLEASETVDQKVGRWNVDGYNDFESDIGNQTIGDWSLLSAEARSNERQEGHRSTSGTYEPGSHSSEDEIQTSEDNTDADDNEDDEDCYRRRQFKEKERAREIAKELRKAHRERTEEEEEEEEMVGKAADRLLPFFVEEWDGCGRAVHAAALHKHNLSGQEHHYLEGTYDPSRQTRGFATTVGLGRPGFPRETGVPRNAHPSGATLGPQFEGTPNLASPPKTVCLHLEHDSVGQHQAFDTKDTDSLIIFPKSLRALRKTMMLCAVYDNSRHIQKALHMPQQVKVQGDDGQAILVSLEFRDLPQTYLGYMHGPLNIVMLGFPRLYSRDQATNFLTKAQEEQFYNLVLRPAIALHSLPGDVGYLPRTQDLADVNAKARSKEQRSRHNDKKQMHHFNIPSNRNGDVWDTMMEIINTTPALAHFQDPVILVDIKNIKAQTSQVNLWESMDETDDMLDELFDEEFIQDEKFAVDLGAIAAAASPDPMTGKGQYTDDAITHNWRRCCVEGFVESLKHDGFDRKSPSVRIFVVAGLWEAVCLTLLPPKHCYLSNGGLIFVQLYGCHKTLFDAMGCSPYQGETVSDICVDNETHKGAVSATKSAGSRRYESGFISAEESKERVLKVVTCNVHVSHGIRLETRIGRKLWRAIKRRARRYYSDNPHIEPLYSQNGPEAAWAIPTSVFMRYLYGNYDKYISLLEMCSVTTPVTGRSIERTRFMRVIVQCIQQLLNSYYPQFPALWVIKKETDGVVLRGLGYEGTLRKYGYAWIRKNVIDWENLRFRSRIGADIAGHIDKQLLSWYPNTDALIIQHTEGRNSCMKFLGVAMKEGKMEREVLLVFAHKLLRAYRGDVLLRLVQAKGIQTDAIPRIAEDAILFTWEELSSVIVNPMNAMSGSKMVAATPQELFEWLWGDKESHIRGHNIWQYKREHWNDLAYRDQIKVFKKSMMQIDRNGSLYTRFLEVLYVEFFSYHWTILYPDPGGAFMSKTKSAQRQVWNVGFRGVFTKEFYWAKKKHIKGKPPAYPRVCLMAEHELRQHLRNLQIEDDKAATAMDID
jgi:hypothetical protein